MSNVLSTPAPAWLRWMISAVVTAVASLLLFTNLGHYAVWCDEADTVIFAHGILATGDLSAVHGDNIYLYRNGSLLDGLVNRYTPPLSYYVAAPFVALVPDATWAVRLPFALCALGCIVLILVWLWRDGADTHTWLAIAMGLLGNASLYLYSRQGRYYALAMLATLVAVYAYTHGLQRASRAIWFVIAMMVLLATQYLNYAALVVALAVDYACWGRHQNPISWRKAAAIIAPQIVVAVLLIAIFNPLGRGTEPASANWLSDRLTLFWWNLRDLHQCEYGVGWLILLAPVAARLGHNRWLLRGFIGLLTYVALVAFVTPQPVSLTVEADIRYLAPLIPLTIYLTVMVPVVLAGGRHVVWIPIVALASFTNVLHQPWQPQNWRSTVALLAEEIAVPRQTSVMAVADWINEHVATGETVAVYPPHQTYPLMVHAPHARYAWQLSGDDSGSGMPLSPELANLPTFHHAGAEPVDWLITFGPLPNEKHPWPARYLPAFEAAGIVYTPVAQLDIYFNDQIRPELFWHAFRPVEEYKHQTEGVIIYQRTPTAAR